MRRAVRKERQARGARRHGLALDRHFKQAVRGFVRVVESCGYTRTDIETAMKTVRRKRPKGRVREVMAAIPAMDAAADVLDLWHSDTRYLDSSAKPRPMPLRGDAPSVESLSLEVAPKVAVDEVLPYLDRPTVLGLTTEGYVALTRVLPFRGSGGPYRARSLRTLNAVLGTLVHNGKPQHSARGWLELLLVGQRVPTSQLPVLDQHARENGTAFLVEAQRRFNKSEGEAKPTEPGNRVLLGIYWAEEPSLPDGSARRRPRRAK